MDILPLKPIGVIRTGFTQSTGTPLHSVYAEEAPGTVLVEPEYTVGLRDLAGFSRVWLLFWCHRAKPAALMPTPYRDTTPRGIFSTRVPARPNPIGLSAVRLVAIEGSTLHVAGVDMLDESLLLDIKPYVSEYDSFPGERGGWVETSPRAGEVFVADERFERSAG